MVHKIASPFGGYYIYPDDPENLFQQMLGVKSKVGQEASHEMTPAVDIYEDESAYFASIEMPGVNKEDVKISCSGGTLTINADVNRVNHDGGHWVQHERRVGTYLRSIKFRTSILEDQVSASYANGILQLTIPKKSDKHKTVSISID